MSTSQRKLTCAALLLVAAGILFGFVQAAIARYDTLPVLQYRSHWMATGVASQSTSSNHIQAAEPKSYTYSRVIDAHTHFIKVATVLLLFALLYPLVSLPEKRKHALAVMFVVGNFAFPAGVLAEIYVRGWRAQALAAAGALLIIVAFAGMLWGLLTEPEGCDESGGDKA